MDQGLLILVVPPNLDEVLVDLLLEQTAISGFTSSKVNAHAANSNKLSLLEQVTGRQQKIQFMIYAEYSALQLLIEMLKKKFANTELRYILLSTMESQLI